MIEETMLFKIIIIPTTIKKTKEYNRCSVLKRVTNQSKILEKMAKKIV
jgi:hypothetical protein